MPVIYNYCNISFESIKQKIDGLVKSVLASYCISLHNTDVAILTSKIEILLIENKKCDSIMHFTLNEMRFQIGMISWDSRLILPPRCFSIYANQTKCNCIKSVLYISTSYFKRNFWSQALKRVYGSPITKIFGRV